MAKNVLSRPDFYKLCTYLKARAGGEKKDTLYGMRADIARDASKALAVHVSPYAILSAAESVELKFDRAPVRVGMNGPIAKSLRRDLFVLASAVQRIANIAGNFDGKTNLLAMVQDVASRNKPDADPVDE